jgi:hypothetical protein
MKNPSALFAVLLPISLGLGLLYLSLVGRMDPAMALASAAGMVVVIRGVIYLSDMNADEKRERESDRFRR